MGFTTVIRAEKERVRLEKASTRLRATTQELHVARAQLDGIAAEREIALREFRDALVVYTGLQVELGLFNPIGGEAGAHRNATKVPV